MNDEYLSHKFSFRPKYYKKVGTPPHVRYFYSAEEYRKWVNNLGDERLRQAKKKEAASASFNTARKLEQDRENAIAKTREHEARKRQEEEAKKKAERDAKLKEQYQREETSENAEVESRRKVAELNKRKQLPEEIRLKDYLFGGQFRKDLRRSRKNLKNIQKELRRQNKEAERLDAQIAKLSENLDNLSGRSKRKLERLQEQRNELQSSIVQNRQQNIKYIEDYSVALYRYQGATLVGSISKKMKSGKSKASRIIEKYSKRLVSSIPKVNVKLKK